MEIMSNLKSSSIQTGQKKFVNGVISPIWMMWKRAFELRDAENTMDWPKIAPTTEIDIARMLKCLWHK